MSKREYMQKVPYAYAVGSLMFAIVCTHLDLVHAVVILGRLLLNM